MKYSLLDFARLSLRIGDKELYRRRHKVGTISDHMFFSYRGFLDDLLSYFQVDLLRWFPLPFPGPWSFSLLGRAVKI